MPPFVSIIGKSNSGKTTLIEKLIRELKKRGYMVGTIKHTHHAIQIDRQGKDSARHKNAGAHTVAIHSPDSLTVIKDTKSPSLDSLALDDIAIYYEDMDIVITEGYRQADKPKIEVFRKAAHKRPYNRSSQDLIAFVTDSEDDLNVNVPIFGLEEIEKIVDFLEKRFL